MRVADVMTTRPVRIRESDSVLRAVELLAITDCSDLMVVGDQCERFVGILAEGDLLRAVLPQLDEVLDAGGSVLDAYTLLLKRGKELADQPIAPYVIRDPIPVHPDDHLGRVTVILVEKYIRKLAVVDGGQLVGTVSRADVARGLVGAL